ncbi:MAG: hypothetical protein K9L17_08435 [Clostridiales bacterium]|nr:hypothetical protein [Clostridiales bacterium]MCF8022703.1 hypothetical protein [Clostridiales bacterium]
MHKDLFKEFDRVKSCLEESFNNGEVSGKLFADFIENAIQIRVEAFNGKVVSTQGKVKINWVVHDHIDSDSYEKRTYADGYMTFDQLKEFSKDPYKLVPKGAEPGNIHIFTIYEDFVRDIAPHILALNQYGATSITCFMWNGKEYAPYEALEIIYELADLVKEPGRYNRLKNQFRNKNIYNINDLEYLKNLKRIAKAI